MCNIILDVNLMLKSLRIEKKIYLKRKYCSVTQEARPDFLTRRVVKCCAPEMISTYIWYHNLGAQPCKSTTENWQEANNGGH